jgi:hypothetical protein
VLALPLQDWLLQEDLACVGDALLQKVDASLHGKELQRANQARGVPNLPRADRARRIGERNPLHPLDVDRLSRFADLLGASPGEHEVLGAHCADHRLERGQMLDPARATAPGGCR